MNHIETAFAYGSSEVQIGQVLTDLYANGVCKREDLILQTKVNPMPSKKFRQTLEKCYKDLRVDYIDVFSFHGLNMDYQYDLIFQNSEGENLIDIVKEYQAQGKIRHIGFSTHAQPELIRKCIETDAFECCNIHYHYFESYTASGGGQFGGNLENIKLMQEKDMGSKCFVSSAASTFPVQNVHAIVVHFLNPNQIYFLYNIKYLSLALMIKVDGFMRLLKSYDP